MTTKKRYTDVIFEYFTSYIKSIEGMLNLVGLTQLNKYLDISLKPFNRIKELDNLGKMALYVLIFSFIFQVIPSLIKTIAELLLNFQISVLETMFTNETWYYFILLPIVIILSTPFISLISLSIMGTIEYYIALMLGGKKGLKDHLKIGFGASILINVISLPLLIIYSIMDIISVIPFEMIFCLTFFPIFIIGVIELFLAFYGLYVKYVMLREWHGLSKMQTIGIMVTPMIIYIIFLFLIVIGAIIGLGYFML